MRRTAVLLALCAFAVLGTGLAQASNVHFKSKGQPSFRDTGLTLRATGALTGLGNADVRVILEAVGQPIATCTNPSGANQPAGHNPAEVEVTGVQTIPADAIKNGNVSFSVSTAAPPTPVPGAPDCPNSNWTETIVDVVFTSATLTVEQPAGTVVLGPLHYTL
jgi:hypothetical protein